MPSDYDEIQRCNRCGFCQSVCPTYAHSGLESQVARGRIRLVRLLKDQKYDWRDDPGISREVNNCLLCRACVLGCPSSVGTDLIMLAAREDFLKINGLSLFQKLVYRGGLSHRERLDRTSFLMRLYEKSGLRSALGKTLLKALDRLEYLDSFLPTNLETPARSQLPEVIKPKDGSPLMKIAFFVGCASNIFGARTIKALANYLAGRGAEVHLPKVACCGEPHRTAGDKAEVRRLALKNISAIFKNDYDFIVSDCSTCAHALANYDKFVGQDTPEAEYIRPLLPKVMDINTLVVEHLGLGGSDSRPLPDTMVTYHDPCHAIRGLDVKTAPREILKAIGGVNLVEMKNADSCCGGAGSYCFTHPEMSKRIAGEKAKNIQESGAGLVATSCPACALQLGAGLKRAGLNLKIVHPVELLAKAENL